MFTTLAPPPFAPPTLRVRGQAAGFPVRRIYCVGRNYGAHVREMGGDPAAQAPLFFMKPADAARGGGEIPYPPGTVKLHHEIELVLALGGGGADIPAERALDLVYGLAVGVDLTRRDLQEQAKARGEPWESAKAFDASAPLGTIAPFTAASLQDGRIRLSVNGALRQEALLSDMIWSPAEIIAAASRLWRLEAGDLIFTGTPEGVGPLERGDEVLGEISELDELRFTIV